VDKQGTTPALAKGTTGTESASRAERATTAQPKALGVMRLGTGMRWHLTGYVELEGVLPECFDGNHVQTQNFLNCFNWFALMDRDATVMKDALKQYAYFLSLIEGPNIEGWSKCIYVLLKKIHNSIMLLPPNTIVWDILEKSSASRSLTTQSKNKPAASLRTL